MTVYRYSLADPFTFETAEKFKGQEVAATASDCGLQHTYVGTLTPVTKGLTKVGEDVLFNECITTLLTKKT